MPNDATYNDTPQPPDNEQMLMDYLISLEAKFEELSQKVDELAQAHAAHTAQSEGRHQAHTQAIQASKQEVTDSIKGEIAKHLYESS